MQLCCLPTRVYCSVSQTMLSVPHTEMAERLEDENEEMKGNTLCKVCQSSEVNVLFLPCGHLVACAQVSFSSSYI